MIGDGGIAVHPGERLVEYFFIFADRTGRMARFDEAGNFVEWTTRIKRASLFSSSEAASAALHSLCRREYEEAVRKGRANKEVDEETGEVRYLYGTGPNAEPMYTPRIPLATAGRNLGEAPDRSRISIRAQVRSEFRAARRKDVDRAGAAVVYQSQSTADDYRSRVSVRAKRAGVYGQLVGA